MNTFAEVIGSIVALGVYQVQLVSSVYIPILAGLIS